MKIFINHVIDQIERLSDRLERVREQRRRKVQCVVFPRNRDRRRRDGRKHKYCGAGWLSYQQIFSKPRPQAEVQVCVRWPQATSRHQSLTNT
ncbi:hypothetical protein J6590_026172 [Homalodisca vitripennis]|nr:hypothetical protein J6590_026172 [Homalodisca vitripennis]